MAKPITEQPAPTKPAVAGPTAAGPTAAGPTAAEPTANVLAKAVAERPGRDVVPFGPGWITGAAAVWIAATIACFAVAVYALGPMLQNNAQRTALRDIQSQMSKALGESQSLLGAAPVTKPAEFGSPVAVLQIPKLKVQQVVIEGVSPSETASGPGHVPGTSGLGQPGNAAVVGRYSGYGAPFADLGALAVGDEIVVATTEGKSVYRVTDTARRALDPDTDYAKTDNDRLTLVTSRSWWPLESREATVVTAVLEGKPFRPTPQNGRAAAQDGRSGDPAGWPLLILALGGFVVVGVGATYLYRRWRTVSTYVITGPALVALTVIAAMAVWRLLPAWA